MAGRQRNIRAKPVENEGELEEETPEILKERLELTKLIQKQRKKHGGTNAEKLALGASQTAAALEPVQKIDAESASMAKLMNSYVKATSIRDSDEDPQMCVAWASCTYVTFYLKSSYPPCD